MRAIKKIIALATGATMLGATIMGAMAVAPNLNTYPDMFVQGETFNGQIGIGDKAAAQDVVGAIDLVGALSVVSVTEEVAGETTAASVSEGVLVEGAGNDLNYGESFADVIVGSLDNEDLPVLLEDQTYEDSQGDNENEVDYTQKLSYTDGTDEIVYEENKDTKKVSTYLKVDKDQPAYTYTLTFDDAVDFTTTDADQDADFEDTYINMLGKEYKITDVTTTADVLTGIKMIGGAVTNTIAQGETTTIEIDGAEYEVECYYIGGTTSKAAFRINGVDSGTLEEGQTKKVGGIRIGVDSIFEEEAGEATPDMVKFYLGAQELEFTNGQDLEVNSDSIDGAEVTISSTAGKWTALSIAYTPDDRTWLAEGEEWTDPVFEKFKYVFTGLDKKAEEIKTTADSDDEGTLAFVNTAGDDVEIPMIQVNSDNNAMFGDDNVDDDVYIIQDGATAVEQGGNMLLRDGDKCYVDGNSTTADITDCEGVYLFVVSAGGEARVLEITDVDTTNNETNLKQIWPKTDSTKHWDDKDWNSTIDLGFTTIEIDYLDTNITGGSATDPQLIATVLNQFDSDDNCKAATPCVANAAIFATELLGEIDLTYDGNVSFDLYEYDEGNTKLANWSMNAGQGTNSDELAISAYNTLVELEDGSDYTTGLDYGNRGAIITFDDENDDELTISYPEELVVAKAYVTPISASIVSGGTTGGTRTVSKRINIGYAKLASDLLAADPDMNSDNYLLVGGPCASEATAVVMGVSSDWPACSEGFEEGKAMIKVVDTGAGKFAMVVAGFSALDTQRATRVLANYGDYALSGDEVEVTGTSLTDISVKVAE